MDSMIHVGNSDKHESADKSAKAIVMIFDGARKHSMDQHIVEKALEAFMRVTEVKQISISGCTFLNKPVSPEATEDETAGEESDPDEQM